MQKADGLRAKTRATPGKMRIFTRLWGMKKYMTLR
jgi:hypothetical protein